MDKNWGQVCVCKVKTCKQTTKEKNDHGHEKDEQKYIKHNNDSENYSTQLCY